jgi:radical SAM superfamily enzyme YgiQ (UPF0313 family)
MILDRILLIYPPDSPKVWTNDVIYRMEPLALEYIAACFTNSEVRIRDLRIEPDLEEYIKVFRPSLVGITGYTCHANTMLRLASLVKANDPKTVVMVGGIHATVRPEDFNVQEIDYIVMGEGTSVLNEWLGKKGDPRGIAGMAYRSNNSIVFNKVRDYPDLGTLPMPRRSLVDHYRSKYIFDATSDFALVRTSLGCPYRCSFCCLWRLTGGRYLQRPIDQIITDLKIIHQKNVFFADDESMIDGHRMMELARRIKEEAIEKKYHLYTRVDTIVNNPELFAAWGEIGLEAVVIGFEAASDDRLARLNKNNTIEDQTKAMAIMRAIGIKAEVGFMIDPNFTRNDFMELRRYIRKEKYWRASINILTPLPGTDIYNKHENELITKDWDYYNGYYALLPTKLPFMEFYKMSRWVQTTAIPYNQKLVKLLKLPFNVAIQNIWRYFKYRIYRYQKMRQGMLPHNISNTCVFLTLLIPLFYFLFS